MTETEYLWERRVDIRIRVLMNRIYYQERQRIFEFREGIVKAASIAAGAVTVSKVGEKHIVEICAAIITGSSAVSLVFGFGAKARDSAKRSSEWALIERDIEAKGERSAEEADLNKWSARCSELEAGEPAQNTALIEKCYVRACKALKCTPDPNASWWDRYRIPIIIH
jgi:hypothetical protein